MPTTTEQFLANKSAREEAEAVVSLAGEQPQRFWECLRDMAIARLPAEPVGDRSLPMNEQEAAKFGRQGLSYGKHAGWSVEDVPTEYLVWLSDGDDFTKQLRRYVQSKTFQERQRSE